MGHSLLLVDDEQEATDSLKLFLDLQGFEVRAAYSGREGIDALKSGEPDLVFLDLAMPGMDGWETLKQMRVIAPDLKVVILTGSVPDRELEEKAKQEGVTGIITKPVQIGELPEKIKGFIGG